MIFLDTNILFWLHEGIPRKLGKNARASISGDNICYSPMVKLELTYLRQIGRLAVAVEEFLGKLHSELVLTVSSSPFVDVCREAERVEWTRDAFDRLIVAEAALHKAALVTADKTIRKHYRRAVW